METAMPPRLEDELVFLDDESNMFFYFRKNGSGRSPLYETYDECAAAALIEWT